MTMQYWLFAGILFSVMFLSVRKNKLTAAGAITGGVIGSFIFLGAGFAGIIMLGVFFLLGTLSTSWKADKKQITGVMEKDDGRRTAGQVMANGGIAGIAGLLSWLFLPYSALFQLLIAAAIAAATADTLSSELGMVYGKKFYNILSFRPDTRGENGVISMEGTLIGITGSCLIAIIFSMGFGWSRWFGVIVIAGTLGNIFDSVLGATLERKYLLNNNAVNFFNTLVAALSAFLLAKFN